MTVQKKLLLGLMAAAAFAGCNCCNRADAHAQEVSGEGAAIAKTMAAWQPGPSRDWFVQWNEALMDAEAKRRPLFVLNTGSTWCGWCKKLKAQVLDNEQFVKFARENLTLVYLDSPCRNADQRLHNKQVAKALKFGGGVPNVRVYSPTGEFLGFIGGGGLDVDAYLEKLRGILAATPKEVLDDNGKLLFREGYAALSAKLAAERAAIPKAEKSDFKAKLVGVAVVSSKNRWKKNADFKPPETHLEVPFGKTALFKVEYNFPTGYEARVWVRDNWPSDQRRNSYYFGSNPSGMYQGRGVATGFLSLLERGKACHLKSIRISTASEPELEGDNGGWTLATAPVDIQFLEGDAKNVALPPLHR